jgi:hypothetical protein
VIRTYAMWPFLMGLVVHRPWDQGLETRKGDSTQYLPYYLFLMYSELRTSDALHKNLSHRTGSMQELPRIP